MILLSCADTGHRGNKGILNTAVFSFGSQLLEEGEEKKKKLPNPFLVSDISSSIPAASLKKKHSKILFSATPSNQTSAAFNSKRFQPHKKDFSFARGF